jgi:hypothetical protein
VILRSLGSQKYADSCSREDAGRVAHKNPNTRLQRPVLGYE